MFLFMTPKRPGQRGIYPCGLLRFGCGQAITADVNIVFEGISPAVKELGGFLVKVLHKLEIEALPKDFPHEIKIDVSKLANIGDRITVERFGLWKIGEE